MRRRTAGAAQRHKLRVAVHARRHVRLRRELKIGLYAGRTLAAFAMQVDVELRERAAVDGRLRLALVFVIGEVVDAIALDRSSERRAVLLVGKRDDAVFGVILRGPIRITEIPGERTGR